jgi:hypothetical protein
VSDFGRSKIIDERGFTSSKASGSVRFLAPELIADPDESGGVESFILTKECDVYAFSMVGVEVSLLQITHIAVLQGHYHRFCLDNNLIPS